MSAYQALFILIISLLQTNSRSLDAPYNRSRFGLYLVDFKNPNKTRTAKNSARLYAGVVSSRGLPPDFDPEDFTAFSGAVNNLPTLLPILALARLL